MCKKRKKREKKFPLRPGVYCKKREKKREKKNFLAKNVTFFARFCKTHFFKKTKKASFFIIYRH